MIENAERWAAAIDAFAAAEEARGVAPSTTARRLKQLRRFARSVELSPWHVDADVVLSWLSAPSLPASTRATTRDSLRAFYRWAHRAGWMQADPTAEVSHRALRLPVPESWAEPLKAYERFLWAKGTAPDSVRAYIDQLRSFARDHRGQDPWSITVDDLYEWMAGKAWARETRRARKVALTGFYAWGEDTGRTAANPTARLPVVKTGEPLARPVTDEEYAAALQRAGDERWALALRLAAELGLRRGEVSRVHSADIVTTPDGAWLTVQGKGSKLRRVPLPPSLALTLRSRPPGYVFPGAIVDKQRASGEGHISPRYLGRQLALLLPPGVTMHALRHRFATRAYNVNQDVFSVQRLLGHASAATTQRYVQVSDARMRALVESIV